MLISVSQRLSHSVYGCWSLQSAFNFVGSRQDTGLSSCVSVASVCHFLYHIAGVLHLVWRKNVSNVLSFFCAIEESTSSRIFYLAPCSDNIKDAFVQRKYVAISKPTKSKLVKQQTSLRVNVLSTRLEGSNLTLRSVFMPRLL